MADSQQNNERTTHVGPVVEPDTLGSPPWNAKAAKGPRSIVALRSGRNCRGKPARRGEGITCLSNVSERNEQRKVSSWFSDL